MLPCQSGCPSHFPGCHKTCAHWREFQVRQREQRQAKKDYLTHYNEVCSCMTRQLRAISVPFRCYR